MYQNQSFRSPKELNRRHRDRQTEIIPKITSCVPQIFFPYTHIKTIFSIDFYTNHIIFYIFSLFDNVSNKLKINKKTRFELIYSIPLHIYFFF